MLHPTPSVLAWLHSTAMCGNMKSVSNSLRCLVLGGTGHVGTAVCRTLAQHATKVAYTYFSNQHKVQSLQAELPECLPFFADLSHYPEAQSVVRAAAMWLGGLDMLIQCAGTAGNPRLYQSMNGATISMDGGF